MIMDKYSGIKTFNELLEIEHGKLGTETRNEYEEQAQMFIIGSSKNPILCVTQFL
jgi:hypothetical protein